MNILFWISVELFRENKPDVSHFFKGRDENLNP